MMEVQPSSRSLILRATHILVVSLKAVDEKPWGPRPAGGEERTVALVLGLDELVKGTVKQKPGDSIDVQAKQVRLGEAWGPMPGVWSGVPLEVGARLVAFSTLSSDDAAAALNDPACKSLYPAERALADVHVAAESEANHLDLAGILARARPVSGQLGGLFADYLWARYEPVAMARIDQFELIAAFLEDPALNRLARDTLVMTLSTAVDGPEPPAVKHISRLAIAMFHLLAMPEAKDLHDNLVGTHLPNLLDITNKDARPASQVFEDHPGERARAFQSVSAYHGSEPTAALLAWLNR